MTGRYASSSPPRLAESSPSAMNAAEKPAAKSTLTRSAGLVRQSLPRLGATLSSARASVAPER